MLLEVFLLLFMEEVFDSSCCYALPKINQDCSVHVLILPESNKHIVQFNVSENKPSGMQI